MNLRTESLRQLNDMAVSYGRKRQSPQTGYLHHCYGALDEPHLPIPVVENFLFALALLRTRLIEHVTEAKTILEGLLHFQAPSGNFPIYLHEFPHCKDRFIGIQVAAIICWILKLYPQGLGAELKKRLEEVLLSATTHALKMHQEKAASYPTALKIATTAKVGGEHLQDKTLEVQGTNLLDQLQCNPDLSSWYCPKTIGQILAALLMVYPQLSEGAWKGLWKHVGETWHRHTCAYIGPGLKEWQQGDEPQVTLYDMFLGYFSGSFSERALKSNPAHLDSVLIPLCEDELYVPSYPLQLEGFILGSPWSLYHGKKMAYSIIKNGTIDLEANSAKAFHSFRLVWGDTRRVHTFVSQGGNGKIIHYLAQPESLLLSFELGEVTEIEEREKCRDVIFCIDMQEGIEFLVEGHKSSTFLLGENISIQDDHCRFNLTFSLEEGEGRFIGHRMLGNRPSQLDTKGSSRFNAYDWQVFLRTVGRSANCRINVSLKILENAEES